MLSTSLGIQFNVNDLESSYEVVGSSDNYSFQYELGRGYDLVDFEGEAFQRSISLEGNYGEFDVRVFAVNDVGVRSAFIETGIDISAPEFKGTFTFNNLRVNNLPIDSNIGSVNTVEPQFQGDSLSVESEYINKNAEISWELIPPSGHFKEGQSLREELLSDRFFDKFEITLRNGTGSQLIDNSILSSSPSLAETLSSSDINESLSNYRAFSINLTDGVFQDLNLDRTFDLQIVSYDSFGRTCTGTITAVNHKPVVESFSYNLRGSDVSFSWQPSDTDHRLTKVSKLSVPSTTSLVSETNLQENIEYFLSVSSAQSWNLGFGSYQSGDMVTYSVGGSSEVYKSISDHTSDSNRTPANSDFWENIGEKIKSSFSEVYVSDGTYSSSQVWGLSHYYSLQPSDGYGEGSVFNLSNAGLVEGGKLKSLSSNVKIGALRFREREDDLVFNWEVVDQDGNFVDLTQYRFSMSSSDSPSLLGISGSLFDSHSSEFLTGITEGRTSMISSVDSEGDRSVVFDLPTTKFFDTYEFTREINNNLYGTGNFVSDFVRFDVYSEYLLNDTASDQDRNMYRVLSNSNKPPLSFGQSIAPTYEVWDASKTYVSYPPLYSVVDYSGSLYQSNTSSFGPRMPLVKGVFDPLAQYYPGDLVVSSEAQIFSYFPDQEYLAGDVVLHDLSFYLCLSNQSPQSPFEPGTNRKKWRVLSMFDEISCYIFRANTDVTGAVGSSFDFSNWDRQTPDNSSFFDLFISGYAFDALDWSEFQQYDAGSVVFHSNDIWSGLLSSQGILPVQGEGFWSNVGSNGLDIVPNYSQNDLVYNGGAVYEALNDNPVGGPIAAALGSGALISSDYVSSQWRPIWERDDSYNGLVYGHVGIPESGKRSIGLELGIIDSEGEVLNTQRLVGINQEPSIRVEGFSGDSLSEASKVKFHFNYAFGSQEKTTKVHLYRIGAGEVDIINSNGDVIGHDFSKFQITGEDGFPYDSFSGNSTLAKITFGASDASFGDNINMVVDEPPIPKIDGVDQPTGYYYKLLPFDHFGSGDIFGAKYNQYPLDKIMVWPKNFSNQNGVPGPVFRTSFDDIPGPVLGLTGDSAFENYFLEWFHPQGEIVTNGDLENIGLNSNVPGDISYYEVWQSKEDRLSLGSLGDVWLKDEAVDNPNYLVNIDFSNNSGYRRIEGNITSDLAWNYPIPIPMQDPALGITNASKIFDIDANSPRVSTSYLGKTNETSYFWVRAVDQAGNKSPFTGAANLEDSYIKGLSLTLGQASATDISDFEVNMTEKFGNTIALVPNNPFDEDAGAVGDIFWPEHLLYYQGVGYVISGAEFGPSYDNGDNADTSYVWWKNDKAEYTVIPSNLYEDKGGAINVIYSGGAYRLSDAHPAGSDGKDPDPVFEDGDFIVAKITNGDVTPVYHAFANALIGTASIANAAIENAKIKDLSADKITAGEIKTADIQISYDGDDAGGIRSVDFDGSSEGFFLSGDGTFGFRDSSGGGLSLDDGQLSLRGRLRQTDGGDYDFGALEAIPSYVNYAEAAGGGFEIINNNPIKIKASLINSSATKDDIRFRMDVISEGVTLPVFSYTEFSDNYAGGTFNLSGFSYNSMNFASASNSSRTFEAELKAGFGGDFGFHDIIVSNGITGEAVMIYASTSDTSIEYSTTISRVIDGKIGVDGTIGVDGNPGPATHFRGEWSPTENYYAIYDGDEFLRGDIVHKTVNGDNYWIATGDSVGQSPSLTSDYWRAFGAEFTSVATDLLLTKEATITQTLTMGVSQGGIGAGVGEIRSANFVGGFGVGGEKLLVEDYSPAGFRLSTTDSVSNGAVDGVIFDVGTINSYLRFSSFLGKVEIKGAFANNSTSETVSNIAQSNNDPTDTLATFVGGGYNNTIETVASTVYKSLASSIVAGAYNTIQGRFSFIGNGYRNDCRDNFSSIVGGFFNTMPSYSLDNDGANFIGGGRFNKIESGSDNSILGGSYNRIL
tara:strand:- start:118 stop:6006 length:5889 start_codon:yes stop_codon:yes gene_type:complete